MIRRRVERLGGAPVLRDKFHRGITGARHAAAERDERTDERRERRLVFRADADLEARRRVVRAANVERQHFELAVETDDRVEDDVENRRVDEMTFGFEDFADGGHGCGARERAVRDTER